MNNEKDWTTIIKPKDRLLSVDFKELWYYRDLCMLFVKRNITTQYKQTILGPFWYLVQPLLTTFTYMVIFGGIAHIPTDGLPQPLFYLAGICLWQYFADCITKTSNTFVDNANLFGKVYFPRMITPIANVISNLVRLGIQMGLFLVVYLIYQCILIPGQIHTNGYVLLTPLLVLLTALMALGFGLLFSALTTKYRDLQMLLSFFVTLWMYATPIVYPLSLIGDNNMRIIMSLNPITGIIEAFKYGALGEGEFQWSMLFYDMGFTAVLLAVGIIIFNKVQKSFMDTV